MRFSEDDRHRSIRRFVMNALGSPPWTVRTERAPVPDDDRPVAVVEVTGAESQTFARTTVPQGDVRRAQAFTITCYPVLGSTPAESRLDAQRTASLLMDALAFGLVDDAGAMLSAPEHLPVYDFGGVPVTGANRAGPDEPYGWLSLADFTVRPLQDPEDPLRWTVAVELRTTWWAGGRIVDPDLPVVGSIPATPPRGTPGVPEQGTPPTTEWPGGMTGRVLGRGVLTPDP